jgi:transcriptional regulator with XRE-family HTH domain
MRHRRSALKPKILLRTRLLVNKVRPEPRKAPITDRYTAVCHAHQVGSRDDPAARARRRAARERLEIGAGIRLARRAAGLSQATVARRARLSQPTVSRVERGVARATVDDLVALAGTVGLDLVARLYPGGSPVRDAAHARIMGRLRALLPASFRLASEVPLPISGDQRAIDAVLVEPALSVGFEIESRLLDAQALVRRTMLKARDARLACMVLVLPDTPANRVGVAAAQSTLAAAFPLNHRAVLGALRAGAAPLAGGILWT